VADLVIGRLVVLLKLCARSIGGAFGFAEVQGRRIVRRGCLIDSE
jgi:hypothetical protein